MSRTRSGHGGVMQRVGDNWTCPHCNRAQVIASERYRWRQDRIYFKECEAGLIGSFEQAIVCANSECRRLSYDCGVFTVTVSGNDNEKFDKFLATSRLLPPSFAKPQPDCIPEPIRADYLEACAIRDLSPKASATLSRRCIQGIIRDFCGIAKRTLKDEIDELQERVHDGKGPIEVHPDTVVAIDHVRNIGNIGAHMEKDIGVIVEVDPGEDQELIGLIETLFEEWYEARQTRATKFGKIKEIAAQKLLDKKQPPRLPTTGKTT